MNIDTQDKTLNLEDIDIKPSVDYIAAARLGVTEKCDDTTICVSPNLQVVDTVVTGGDFSKLEEDRTFFEKNKELVSEYISICWYINSLEERRTDIINTLNVIRNEHIDIDITSIELTKSKIEISLDDFKRRQVIFASTYPDIVDYLQSSIKYMRGGIMDMNSSLYPYESMRNILTTSIYSISSRYATYNTGQGVSSLGYKPVTVNFMPYATGIKGHADPPGERGAQGIFPIKKYFYIS